MNHKYILLPILLQLVLSNVSFAQTNSSQSLKETTYYRMSNIYGPLLLDLSRLTFKNNIFIVPFTNHKDQKLYLAVSCIANKINITNKDYSWNKWFAPEYKFEKKIIQDICFNPLFRFRTIP